MNYDFLQSYNIPVSRQSNEQHFNSTNSSTMEGAYGTYSMQTPQDNSVPAVNTAFYGYGGGYNSYDDQSNYQTTGGGTSGNYYQNPERFISPAKHGSGYVPHKPAYKRKNSTGSGASAPKKEAPIPEVNSNGTLVMFMGRDESYPDGLNELIHPLACDLCNVKMNSRMLAKDHYESKAHDKHISSWLFKNYTEKGINPPAVKRYVKAGPTGPDAFYCESCDLKLTSLTHANQHYAGKKHRLVIAQRSKPSGAGFYNSEGKWVRTGTKATPTYNNRRFGIGDEYLIAEMKAEAEKSANMANEKSNTTTSVADTTTNTNESETNSDNVSLDTTKPPLSSNTDQDPTLFCSICKVSVTSAVQMNMHLSGARHVKKLKLAGVKPSSTDTSAEGTSAPPVMDNILLSVIKDEIKPDPIDLSMYRTPSGQFYCKTCNTSMSHLPGLEQHLKGKRHLKKLTEEKAMASLAAKKK